MKSVLPAAVAATLLALGNLAVAAPADDARAAVEAQSSSANEQAGLPDLAAINRPGAEVTSKVDINVPRTPSYHEVSPTGTEITEYRDKGKPVEIDVKSNFGTRYTMSAPADTSPQVRDNGRASTRLPSINLRY
ncbi:hypothetical protein [Paraburkholderia caballeronis]|uniref:DUF2782 domain-containing protein n=1 Tax=Paraburkholderia caballeronis TaxID=416943 RepID=A0A1H7KX06_9BURK|nr:hypothetical protein [Paraburkholderia caballeronis]PXW28193.1 hypothetical protein C7403_10284 [Paraburkholderia caballeronis]PXX03559.1 hypothetical protein C7407_10284 [Paraburkholderia caballeronis]RAK04303.1 hypothetical protein C7409_10284 [Paraburkholderia caballeronis]TDV19346.1 hypothetical protein C7408_10288 [Paraburkholderia caballeronis]TDV21946.1 hypothetical protein C7406_10188 [Paraburkholderia caballeronis]